MLTSCSEGTSKHLYAPFVKKRKEKNQRNNEDIWESLNYPCSPTPSWETTLAGTYEKYIDVLDFY